MSILTVSPHAGLEGNADLEQSVRANTAAHSLYMRAARGESLARPPVWFMRQAGRYLPEYNAIRSHCGFLDLCRTPELACEVTLQPIRRFSLDAAILFSDILIPLPALGLELSFDAGHGPRIANPLRTTAALESLRSVNTAHQLSFVYDAIRQIRRELSTDVALIGFAGGPFTVASYIIEGGKPEPFARVRSLMAESPVAFLSLMDTLSTMTAAYLDQQISAGADAVQIFDTWAGILNEAEYRRFVLPALQRLFVQLRRRNVPLTYFALNSGHLLSAIRECGASIIGVDAHTSLTTARTILGERVLQGNLDPLILMNDEVAIRAATQRVLADGAGGPHIFNVGHGLQPTTPISALEIVLDEIRGSQL